MKSNGHELYCSDNKKLGEVDFMVDDYDTLGVKLIEVKSGKCFRNHKSLDKYIESSECPTEGIVLSNRCNMEKVGNVTYMPIYMSMFL